MGAPAPEPRLRHTTWRGAVATIITAVIGAGVLSLPFATSWLGWIAGPLLIIFFAAVTLWTSALLADCQFVHGKRNRTYTEAVESVFGRTGGLIISWIQYSNLWLTAVAYNITGAVSMQTIAAEVCSVQGKTPEECNPPAFWVFAVIFAGAQIPLAQLPSMESTVWVNVIGAIMSFGYSFIALGLSIGKVADGNHHGTMGGRPGTDSFDKTMQVFNAFGAIIFAFAFSMILIEIQDTIQDDPAGGDALEARTSAKLIGGEKDEGGSDESGAPAGAGVLKESNAGSKASRGSGLVVDEAVGGVAVLDDRQRYQVREMQKAIWVSMIIITFFFMSVACFGYLAFGNTPCGTSGNILTCFDSPAWLVLAANIMVCVHVAPAYQVYSQPVFGAVERLARESPRLPAWVSSWPACAAWRCAYVAVNCLIACALPFFSDMVSLIGAIGFWPASVIFPIAMWVRVYKPGRRRYFVLQTCNVVSFVLTICATAGSIYAIVQDSASYQIFSR